MTVAPVEDKPNPYRFTVSVEQELPSEWAIYVEDVTRSNAPDALFIAWFPTEAEAREHAELIRAALQAVTVGEG